MKEILRHKRWSKVVKKTDKIYEDDNIIVIEDDLERIRAKSGMFIGYAGRRGALHLGKETVNNMIDECTNSKSPGRNIEILLDTEQNLLMVSDDGRGIPFDKLELVCTKIQSSSKMVRDGGGGASAGENGVGMTATNALSARFELISARQGEEATIKFSEGKLTQPLTVKKIRDKGRHGQTIIFKPSEFILSVEDDPAIIDKDDLEAWVESIAYLLPPDVTMRFNATIPGGKMYSKKYRNENGMYDLLDSKFKKTTDIIHLKDILYFTELEKGEKFKRYTGVEVALAYSTSDSNEYTDSFCNFVNTVDGGTHANAVSAAALTVLKEFTEKSMSESQAKKLNILPSDVRSGLKVLINIKTESNPQFSGQVKEKVNSQLLYKQIRPMIMKGLRDTLNNNEKLKKRMTDIIKTNAKARIAADSEKEAVMKQSKTEYLDMYDNDKVILGKVRNIHEYSECLIVEGDSAGNAIKKVGLDFQFAQFLRGVTLNAYTSNLAKVMSNAELRTFVRLCRAGIGDNFKLDKFFFDKIILMVDGDSDGNHIFSSFSAFLLKWMRPLVEDGRVYRVLSPLYKIQDKDNPFILDRQEYFEVYVKNVTKNIKVGTTKGGLLSKQELRDLLSNNRDYLVEMDRLVNFFGIHQSILEFIVLHIQDKDFTKKLKKRFPEMHFNGSELTGIHESKFQFIKLNKRFFKQAKDLNDIVYQPANKSLYYQMFNKDGKTLADRGEFTIGELMTECLVYRPTVTTRYKGLGELKEKQLLETTLDPNNRILVRMTVADIEKAMEVADIFHGNDSSKRKEANSKFKIRRDELDN